MCMIVYRRWRVFNRCGSMSKMDIIDQLKRIPKKPIAVSTREIIQQQSDSRMVAVGQSKRGRDNGEERTTKKVKY